MTPARLPRLLAGVVTTLSFTALASEGADRKEVARLDTEYQAAVKRNDAEEMGRILHERFTLVLGNGKTYNRKDLIDSAKAREIVYEKQDEEPGTQTVRVYGNTAVVTALLWLKGVSENK